MMTSWSIFSGGLRESRGLFTQVFKSAGMLLIFLHVVQFLSEQVFTLLAEQAMAEGRENIAMMILAAGVELVFNLLWSSAWILVIAHFLSPETSSILKRFPGYFQQIIIEQIRALAAILFRVPLLILPALIEYIRLSLVPYIVALEPAYDRGEVDALKRSRELSRRHLLLLSACLLASVLATTFVSDIAHGDGSQFIWENPLGSLSAAVLTLFVNVFMSIFLVAVYRRLSKMSPRS